MMDCTDRHDRFFLRLISKNVMLYSEMVATKSALHGDRKKILGFREEEKPLALILNKMFFIENKYETKKSRRSDSFDKRVI